MSSHLIALWTNESTWGGLSFFFFFADMLIKISFHQILELYCPIRYLSPIKSTSKSIFFFAFLLLSVHFRFILFNNCCENDYRQNYSFYYGNHFFSKPKISFTVNRQYIYNSNKDTINALEGDFMYLRKVSTSISLCSKRRLTKVEKNSLSFKLSAFQEIILPKYD